MKFVCAILLFATAVLRAEDIDDAIPDDATRVDSDIAAWCEVDGHRFVFEKTTLGQIIKTLGAGTLERTGNAGAATFEYRVSYPVGSFFVRFESNNDMGGPDHELESVVILPRPLSGLAPFPAALKLPIRFPFGLSSITFAELQRKLGSSAAHDSNAWYLCSQKYRSKNSSGVEVVGETDSSLRVILAPGGGKNPKIVGMEVNRVTSF